MADGYESSSSAKVRDLIFAYERHSSSTQPLEEYHGRPRAKSTGNALSYKLFREPNLEFYSILDIEKELVKIEAHLNYYEVYEKETHVAFQEQLFNVLTSIVNIDPDDQEDALHLKKKLILETQKLATNLNSRLPFDGNHSYKGARRTYSSYVRKEEAVVSTTSIKNHEHRAILSSHNSFNNALNGDFKSEESLNSTRDSVDQSSRQGESSIDLSYLDERAESSTPTPQKKVVDDNEKRLIPSVSKLKQFFSFRREEKPKVTSALYSGISRSQSLNIRTNKHSNVTKRSKKDEARKQEAISESDEIIEKSSEQGRGSPTKLDTSETINFSQTFDRTGELHSSVISAHTGPVRQVDEVTEQPNESTHNVSVSKLKSLFEQNQNETNEGLGLLTKKQNEISSSFDLPFTAMNLGAYRLKRTISGNYMNFTGLIRNVEISKKGDLSKSKSLSDLKITNFGYGTKDLEVDDDDLSKEIDDNDDFEHVSIDVGKESKEVNNNENEEEVSGNDIVKGKEPSEEVPIELGVGSSEIEEKSKGEVVSTSTTSQTVHRGNETIFLSKSVETLKQAFENLSTGSEHASKEGRDDRTHIIYKTNIEPVPSNTSVVVEPVLKVPIQFRTGVTKVNTHTAAVRETSTSSIAIQENNDEITHTLHRTIEPISSSTGVSEEPKLRIPIQLRPGYVNVNQSREASAVTEDHKVTDQHQHEPVVETPIQLRLETENTEVNGFIHFNIPSLGISEATEKFIQNEKTFHESNATLYSTGSVETLKQTYENIGASQSDVNEEEIEQILHRKIEPISSSAEEPVLKVPIQLRIGVINSSSDATEQSEIIQTEVNNKETEHTLYRTVEPISSSLVEPEEPVPLQLGTDLASVSHSNEVTGNVVDKTFKATSEPPASPGTVELLTQTFENMSTTGNTEVNNEDVKHIIHRTIEPISGNDDNSKEPVLKVPIQLRIGVINSSSDATEQSEIIQTEVNNEETEHTLYRTVEPISSSLVEPEEPVPLQLGTDLASVSHSYEVTGNVVDKTFKATSESPASPGTVEFLTQTFENMSTIGNTEVNNEDVKHIINRTIEPIPGNDDNSKEPVLKVPIQLRTFAYTSDTQENTGNISSTIATELSDEEVYHIIHRTIQPIPGNDDNSKEPVLKVPVQLRTFAHRSETQDNTENIGSTIAEVNNEEVNHIIHRTIEPIPGNEDSSIEPVLKVPIQLRTFVHTSETQDNTGNISSTISTEVNNEDVSHIIHRTIEPIPGNEDSSIEPVLKVPIQLRTFPNISNFHDVTVGDVEVVANSSHNKGDVTEKFLHSERGYSQQVNATETNSGDFRITTDIKKNEEVPMVDVSHHRNDQGVSEISGYGTMSRATVEEKTGSLMRTLDSPSQFSVVSSSSIGDTQQASRTSQVSISYSAKRSVQHTTSSQVSQRLVSSSSSSLSSQQSGQSYLQVLEKPSSYSLLRSINPPMKTEESTVTVTESEGEVGTRRKLKYDLNISQENIIDELLKDSDLENLDEEFDKILEENAQ